MVQARKMPASPRLMAGVCLTTSSQCIHKIWLQDSMAYPPARRIHTRRCRRGPLNAFLAKATEAETIRTNMIESGIAVSRWDRGRRRDATACAITRQSMAHAQIFEFDRRRTIPPFLGITTCYAG